MLREYQAWCPACYQEELDSGMDVYNPLLWSFRDLEVCHKHRANLVTECPFCHKKSHTMDYSSRVGFCHKCKCWLGSRKNTGNHISPKILEWQGWVYENLAHLLSFATIREHKTSNNIFIENIKHLIWMNPESTRGFAESINVHINTVNSWIYGTKKPSLKYLLILAYCLNKPVIDILTKEISVKQGFSYRALPFFGYELKHVINLDAIKNVVDEAPTLENALSILQISVKAGIDLRTLRNNFPTEVVKLKVKYDKVKPLVLVQRAVLTLTPTLYVGLGLNNLAILCFQIELTAIIWFQIQS